ncbi:hypothetical protein BC962_0289 [Gillisia mitskevichiae]|uniref:Uncharacterized protein n=1 Tax=Gillisia mitskevichiae TaxID=270921 RepID=A0A495PYE3_9FLAO|nr:hypothetical protein [Gillisia mitskevichiae]RKS55329.1 hypothetical protein BC962_0289 [Gillisia mitskevichiae]
MKKKLESELKNLANTILNNTSGSSTTQLKQMAKELYEKLTIMSFTEDNLSRWEETPSTSIAEKKEETIQKVAVEPEKDEYLPDGTEYNSSEAITELNTEMIKDIVAQMPPETEHVDSMVEGIIAPSSNGKLPENSSEFKKSDFRDIGVDYDNLPSFEPVKKQDKDKPRSLNDRLKKGINIGLNERLSFIKHLFDGHTNDYNRVISQLNTFDNLDDAHKFIQQVVKPDYKNWAGKEEYEERFMALVENKFNH